MTPRASAALLLAASLLIAATGQAQDIDGRPPVDRELKALPLSAALDQVGRAVAAAKANGPAAEALAVSEGLLARPDGRVHVEIENLEGDTPIGAALVTAHGGEVHGTWRGLLSAWLPPAQARELAAALPPGYLLRHANLGLNNNEGPAAVASDLYRDQGSGGAGIRIGILDRGFARLDSAQIQQPSLVPPVIIVHDYTGTGAFSGSNAHGAAQVETIYDHAPDATYHIFKINSTTDLGNAVDDAIAEGIHILSATQSWYNTGWADGSGPANQAVDEAGNAGILYFNSAGNRAQTHWQGDFADADGDDWHGWLNGSDEWNDFTVPAQTTIFLYLHFDTGGAAADYDLYLYNGAGTIVDQSTSGGTTPESIVWANGTNSAVTMRLAVYRYSGAVVEFEVFKHQSNAFEHAHAASSLTPPTNNLHRNTVSIGAVVWSDHLASSSAPITSYSSQGPTNSGNRGLDLAAPTSTQSWTWGSRFGGTSCATPNAAGAAAAFWAEAPHLDAVGVRETLFRLADMTLDWGAGGIDPVYGYGGMHLHSYADQTTWLDRSQGNAAGVSTRPYFTLGDAEAAAASGGRILVLGGSYPEAVVLDKPLVIESAVENAVLGDN